MCDKLNSTTQVSEAVNKAGAYYQHSLGDICSNKTRNAQLKELFAFEIIKYSETKIDQKARRES